MSIPAKVDRRTRNDILVDSLDAAVEKVTAFGGTITTPKSPVATIGWYAAGTDCEGNPLALYERAPVR
jgi:predicted enzyme related to lactoylglutathione lyase